MTNAQKISRDEYLAQASVYLKQGQPIPQSILEKLGVGSSNGVSNDSPDLDTYIESMKEHRRYLVRYHKIIDEIKSNFDLS